MRETIVWIIFLGLLALAAFEAGWIARDFKKDDTREMVLRNNDRVTGLSGRVTVLEGPPIPRKVEGLEGRKQKAIEKR